jgi:hypothetical protein
MIAVWFSYPPHYAALAKSVESVMRVCPHAKTAVVLRHEDPPPSHSFNIIIRDDFPRNEHLTGTPATHGIIQVLAQIAATNPSDIILKIDSDMILQSDFWGTTGRVYRRMNGSIVGVYAIPAKVLLSLPAKIVTGLRNMPKEAITIGRHAIQHGVPVEDIQKNVPEVISLIRYSSPGRFDSPAGA